MAREIRLGLVIDGVGQSIQDIERLNSGLNRTEGNLDTIGDNRGFDELGQSAERATNKVDKSNQSLENTSSSASKLGNRFSSLAKGFEISAKGISGAVNITAGAMGLLSKDNEKLQETLLKVNSALALTTGLKDFSEFLSDITDNTKLASIAQSAYNLVVGQSTGGLKLLKLALAAVGIGAIIIGLGLLISNWDAVVDAVMSAIDAFDNLGTGVKVVLSILFPMIGLIKGIQFALEELGIIESKQEKENKKIYAERSKRLEEERKAQDELNAKKLSDIDKEIARNKSLGLSVDALNIKRKEEEIAINAKALAEAELYLALQTRYGFATEADRKFVEGIRKSQEDLQFELEILNNEQTTANKERNSKIAEDNKKAADEKTADDKERADKKAADEKQRQDEYFRRINKQTENEINAIKKADEDLKKSEDQQRMLQNRDDLAAIEIRLLNVEKGSLEELDILQEKLLLQSDIELQNEKLTTNEKELINQKYFADLAALDESYRVKEKENLQKSVTERREAISESLLALGSAFGSIEGPLSGIGDLFAGITQNVDGFKNSITSAITTFNTEGATLEEKVGAVGESIVAGLEIFGGAIDQIATLSAEKSEERVARIENETSVQSRELDAQFKKGLITEEQLSKAQQEIERKKNIALEKERKKEFEKQKKLRIVSATIDMIQGAVSAFVSGFTSGIPFPGNVIVGSALSASVLAFGAVNISKIAKQKYEGSGAGGGGGGDAASIPSPPSPSTGDAGPTAAGALSGGSSARTDLFGVNTGAVGGASNIEGLGQPSGGGGSTGPQRVYVVESDITRVQDRVSVIQSDSTIG
jgi:hypothetical protein